MRNRWNVEHMVCVAEGGVRVEPGEGTKAHYRSHFPGDRREDQTTVITEVSPSYTWSGLFSWLLLTVACNSSTYSFPKVLERRPFLPHNTEKKSSLKHYRIQQILTNRLHCNKLKNNVMQSILASV